MPVSVIGIAEAVHLIDGVGYRAVHAKPAMRKITGLLVKGEMALWKRSGGKKWPPRADGTKAGVLTGDLERSLTQLESEGAVREIHDDHLVFGTGLWYGRFMQAGTKVNGEPHEPKRPILVYRPTDRKATKTIIELHLLGELP